MSGERYTTKLGNSFKRLGGSAEIFIKKCRKCGMSGPAYFHIFAYLTLME